MAEPPSKPVAPVAPAAPVNPHTPGTPEHAHFAISNAPVSDQRKLAMRVHLGMDPEGQINPNLPPLSMKKAAETVGLTDHTQVSRDFKAAGLDEATRKKVKAIDAADAMRKNLGLSAEEAGQASVDPRNRLKDENSNTGAAHFAANRFDKLSEDELAHHSAAWVDSLPKTASGSDIDWNKAGDAAKAKRDALFDYMKRQTKQRAAGTSDGPTSDDIRAFNRGDFKKLDDDTFAELAGQYMRRFKGQENDPGIADHMQAIREDVSRRAHEADETDGYDERQDERIGTSGENEDGLHSAGDHIWTTAEEAHHKTDIMRNYVQGRAMGEIVNHNGLMVDKDLVNHPAYQKVMADLDAKGLGGLRKQVFAIMTHSLPDGVGGVAWKEKSSGKTVIVLDYDKSMKKSQAAEVTADLHHEMGHAVQDALNVMGRPEWGEDGGATIVLQHLYDTSKYWSKELAYPLNNGSTDSALVREEMFAQAWSMYNRDAGNINMKLTAPNVAKSLEAIHEQIRSNLSGPAERQGGDRGAHSSGSALRGPQGRAGVQGLDGQAQGRPGRIRTDSTATGNRPRAGEPASSQGGANREAAGVRSDQAANPAQDSGNLRAVRRATDPKVPATPEASKALHDEIERLTPQYVKDTGTRIADFIERIAPKFLTPEQIYQRFKDRLPTLEKLHFLREARIAEVNRIQALGTEVISKIAHLGHGDKDKLNGVMHDATVLRIHPDKAFDDKANAHLTTTDTAQTAKNKADHAALAARYKGLGDKSQGIYQDALKLGQRMKDEDSAARKAALEDAVSRSMTSAADRGDFEGHAKLADNASKAMDKMDADQPGPYFPLMRHGDYISVGESKELVAARKALEADPGKKDLQDNVDALERKPSHYIVEAHEKAADQKKAVAQYNARGMVGRTELRNDHLAQSSAKNLAPLRHLFEVNFDKDTAQQLNDLLDLHHANSLGANHALSRRLERRNIAGASTDMRRGLSEALLKSSRYLAGQKFNSQIDAAIHGVTQEAKGNNKLTRVAQTLQEAVNLDRNPVKTPAEDWLTGLTHVFEIGITPARIISYAVQPHMISVPMLSGDFGFGKSINAMNQASADAFRLFKAAKAPDGQWHGSHGLDLSKPIPGLTANEMDLIRHMQDTSQMERGMHTDLSEHSEAEPTGAVNKTIEVFHHVETWALGHVDTATRTATALAAYRLHMEANHSHEAAMRFAQDHVKLTQFEYGRESAPLIFRSGGGVPMARLLFQFKRYQQGCLNLLYGLAERSFKGDTGAMKSFGILMGTHALLAGAMGMPMAQTAMGLFNGYKWLMGEDDDTEGDASARLRTLVYSHFGKDFGQAVMDGITAPLGINMTQQVGMGSVLTDHHLMPNGFGKAYDAKNSQKLPAIAEGLLGPSGGIFERLMDGRQFFQQGNYLKAAEEMMPETIAGFVEAGREYSEGITDNKNRVAIPGNKVGLGNALATAAGFKTEQKHLFNEENSSKMEMEQTTALHRNLLTQRFSDALAHGGDTGAVMRDVQDFNSRHMGPGKLGRLTVSDLMKSAVQYRRAQMFRGASGVGYDPRRERQAMHMAEIEDPAP